MCSGSAPANNLDVIGEVRAGSSACGGEVFYSLRFVVVRGSSFWSRLLRVSPFCLLVVTCTCTTLVFVVAYISTLCQGYACVLQFLITYWIVIA